MRGYSVQVIDQTEEFRSFWPKQTKIRNYANTFTETRILNLIFNETWTRGKKLAGLGYFVPSSSKAVMPTYGVEYGYDRNSFYT